MEARVIGEVGMEYILQHCEPNRVYTMDADGVIRNLNRNEEREQVLNAYDALIRRSEWLGRSPGWVLRELIKVHLIGRFAEWLGWPVGRK